ncbi:outer membrane beta-barrel protein [Fulvivirga lutimaris]|uniref:outer membrane beta-barrel protein n=1 Tax=Fulvivirga lutimaris TaxID=1819566 RepID=UPI0012BCCA16|nr:outer membrane beta-barrel family protein [Fulvivirga lutimaris]MTI40573.1 hypothetical protein [Fulvivirga lutimaris]
MKNGATFLLICISFSLQAQFQVSGKYVDGNQAPLPYANVLLLNSSDSTLVKGDITDTSGKFMISTSKSGPFILQIKFIGYKDVYTDIFQLTSANPSKKYDNLIGTEDSKQLSEVVIEAEKPLFEQKIDRTIINVESNISASGGSTLDVLARSPGITVDRMNNSIALAGKQGVRIMINGKISQMPLDAAVQMLDGMNAESLEKIELITTPPAKYEAQGDAGMINIVLKKSIDTGTNGNLSLFSGYGRKEKYGGSINFNNRSEKFNIYGDYAYRMNVTQQLFTGDRSVLINNDLNVYDTDNDRDAFTRVHNGRIGIDWNIGKKTTIGGLISAFDRNWEMDALADIYQYNSTSTQRTTMSTFEINKWLLLLGNFNITHDINDKQSLSIDLDYIDYDSENPTDYDQNYFDQQGALSNTIGLTSKKKTPIKTWVSKIDYSFKISEKVNLEAGGKYSSSRLNNDIIVENLENGILVRDDNLTSLADMEEDISAGYLASTINVSEKIDIQAGLRYEHTITNIDTEKAQNVVDRNFGNWFPSVFFQNTINKNNSFVLSYSRRITRPSFFQIAPFVIFLDPNSFWSGNESLLPALTDAFKAEYRFKSILLSLQYSHDKNSISLFQPRINEDNKQVSKAENLDYRNNYSVNLSVPFSITKWWEWQINGAFNYINLKAIYLDNPVDLTIKNLTFNGSQKFSLPHKFTIELSGYYQSKQLFGVSELKALGALNFGLEKKFSNSQLRIAYNDIFETSQWYFTANIPEANINSNTHIGFETNVLMITYSRSFGNNNIKKRNKSTGSEEEQSRFQ